GAPAPMVPGLFLVLEGLARCLPPAGRADRAVRDRRAVRGAQAAEIPALHAARKALADRCPGDVDELADDEMIGRDLRADRNQIRRRDAKLRQLAHRLDLST